MGSLDRFTAFLLEETKGILPLWLAPTQVKIVTVAEKFGEYAEQLKERLVERGIRVEVDNRNETIGKKIREAGLEKVPYTLIIGEKEIAEGSVAVRKRKVGDLGSMTETQFTERLLDEIKNKNRD